MRVSFISTLPLCYFRRISTVPVDGNESETRGLSDHVLTDNGLL